MNNLKMIKRVPLPSTFHFLQTNLLLYSPSLSVCPSVCLFLAFCRWLCVSLCLSLPVCLSVSSCVAVSAGLFVNASLCICLRLSVCLSVSSLYVVTAQCLYFYLINKSVPQRRQTRMEVHPHHRWASDKTELLRDSTDDVKTISVV